MPWIDRLGRWWWRLLIVCVGLAAALAGVALILPRTPLVPTPQLIATTPVDTSQDVPPSSALTLKFSVAMDRASVESAVTISPGAEGSWEWPDAQTAIWTPKAGWNPATTYSVQLSIAARSTLRRPLAEPIFLQFSTATAAQLSLRYPQPGATVPAISLLALDFDRQVRPADATQPLVMITPALALEPDWVAPTRLIAPLLLKPATTYTITIAPLVDEIGTQLTLAPWSFRTAAPQFVRVEPASGSLIAQQPGALPTPIRFVFMGELAGSTLDAINDMLRVEPAISGRWSHTYAEGQTTLTFMPDEAWPNGAVSATLALGDEPHQWHWEVGGASEIVASVPGSNGVIEPTSELRVVFSQRPVLEALRNSIAFEPSADITSVRLEGQQLHIVAALAPATAYTLSLALGADQTPFVLPFRTAAQAQPVAVGVPEPWIVFAPGAVVTVPVTYNQVLSSSATLYRLTRSQVAALLRAPGLAATPERLGLTPLDVPATVLSDTITLPITQAGSYLMRFRNGDQSASEIISLAPFVATLVVGDDSAGVHSQGGVFEAQLLRGGAIIARGSSDERGSWVSDLEPGQRPDAALLGDEAAPFLPMSVIDIGQPQEATLVAFADRAIAYPGEAVRIVGSLSQLGTQPANLRLRLVEDTSARTMALQSIPLNPSGSFSATVMLRESFEPGAYIVQLGEHYSLPLRLAAAPVGDLTLAVAPSLAPGTALSGEIRWPQGPRQNVELRISSDQALERRWLQTDETGTAAFSFYDIADQPGLLTVSAASASSAITQTIIVEAQQYLVLETERLIVELRESMALTATLSDRYGQPIAGEQISFELGSTTLAAESDANGVAAITWRADQSGVVRAQARSREASSNSLELGVTQAGRAPWPEASSGILPLIIEQHAAGLRILPLLSSGRGEAALIWEEAGSQRIERQPWQAGQTLVFSAPGEATQPALVVSMLDGPSVDMRWATLNTNRPQSANQALSISPNLTDQSIALSAEPGTILTGTVELVARERYGDTARVGATGPWWRDGRGRAITITAQLEAGINQLPLELPPSRAGWEILALAESSTGPLIGRALVAPQAEPAPLWAPARMLIYEQLRLGQASGAAELELRASPELRVGVEATGWVIRAARPGSGRIAVVADGVAAGELRIDVIDYQKPLLSGQVVTTEQTLGLSVPPLGAGIRVPLSIAPGLGTLAEQAEQDLAQQHGPLAASGRIALAQEWGQTPTPADLAEVAATQGPLGGWSWGAGDPDPLLTALIALNIQRGNVVPESAIIAERALPYLRSTLNIALAPDVRAHSLAALAPQQDVSAAINDLLANEDLSASSRLILADGLIALRRERQASRVIAASLRAGIGADGRPWMGQSRASALAVTLLAGATFEDGEASALLAGLAAEWQGTGWSDTQTTIDAIRAIRSLPPITKRPVRYSLSHQGDTISEGLSAWQGQVFISGGAAPEVTVSTRGPVFIATPSPPQFNSTISQEFVVLDEERGGTAQSVAVGQRVTLAWHLIVREPVPYVAITVPAVTGFHVEAEGATETLREQTLQPGVYTITRTGWFSVAGGISQPPLQVQSADRLLNTGGGRSIVITP